MGSSLSGDLRAAIASAFVDRPKPRELTNVVASTDLREHALQFAGKAWTDITAAEWTHLDESFYGLSPEAFAYFLPSLLVASLDNQPLNAADSLVALLDTSADPDVWPCFFEERFALLNAKQLAVLREWSIVYLSTAPRGEGSEFDRVQDTLTMLEMRLDA